MSPQEENTSNDVFAENLRRALSAKGWTQGDLTAACGITQGTISNYARGKREPTASQLRLLANALGVTMEWLLTGRGAPTIEETISAGEQLYQTPMTQEQRAGARRILEKRQLAYQPDKILMMLAQTEDRLSAAEKEVVRLEAKLAAVRKALE